jgi:outer membrane protein OmpA-like peptidoglycan-associated protein
MRSRKLVMIAVTALVLSGCATKEYVDERVSGLNTRMDAQDARINELTRTSSQALARAEEAGVLAKGKFLYTVVLTEEGIVFATNESTLSDAAQTRLTSLARDLKANNANVYLEIQGHTDATGEPDYNEQLGLQRAERARRFLHREGVSLDRMATISYGEDAPIEPNNTPEGRASNRRVEIVVLE